MSGALTQESNDLVERLAQYGIIPSATPVTTEERSYVQSGSSELMHRNPMLEIVRYLMLVALAAMTGVTVWLIVRTLSIDLESGRIPAGEIDAIDLIRRTEFVVAQVALVSICAWALMVVSVTRGHGIAASRSMRIVVALFSVVVAASGASLAFDLDRTAVSLAVLAFDAIAVGAASGESRRVDERLGGGSMALGVWANLLLLVPISMWAAELYRPIDVDAEVGSILFFSAVRVMVLAASVTLAGVATGRVDERIRFALAAADAS